MLHTPTPLEAEELQKIQDRLEDLSPDSLYNADKILTAAQTAGLEISATVKMIRDAWISDNNYYNPDSFLLARKFCNLTSTEEEAGFQGYLTNLEQSFISVNDTGDLPILAAAKAAGMDISKVVQKVSSVYNTDDDSQLSEDDLKRVNMKRHDTCYFRMALKYCDFAPEEKRKFFQQCLEGPDMEAQAKGGDTSYIAYLLRDSVAAGVIDNAEAEIISQEIVASLEQQNLSFGKGIIAANSNIRYIFDVGFEHGFLNPKKYAPYIIEGWKLSQQDYQKKALRELAQKYGISLDQISNDQVVGESEDVARAKELSDAIKEEKL